MGSNVIVSKHWTPRHKDVTNEALPPRTLKEFPFPSRLVFNRYDENRRMRQILRKVVVKWDAQFFEESSSDSFYLEPLAVAEKKLRPRSLPSILGFTRQPSQ